MKKYVNHIVSVTLILSIVFLHTPQVFADDAADTTPVTSVDASSTSPQDATESSSTPITFPDLSSGSTTEATTTSADISSITASTTNDATTTNMVTASSTTGDNIGTTIGTGNALSNANVTNVVNVNIFNSDALLAFLNQIVGGGNSVDLRDALMSGDVSCVQCNTSTTTLTSTSTNSATIDNTVIVRSGTGNNTASSSNGSLIQTGNAYANANVVNVANTNLINSHYVMLILNNFGSFSGDIVLPNASFFDNLISSSQTTSQSTTPVVNVTTTNTASTTSNVTTTADTGNNSIATGTSTDQSVIQTGDAHSGSTVLNDINKNQIGGTHIAIVFRIFGDWSGKMFNLPSQFMWHNTPVGIQFLSDTNGASIAGGGSITSNSTNNATISNNVSVSASTGNNTISGGSGLISTGNAYANANVVNMANTNIIGSNWINAIINIFGDWSGNISFGQPDLWIGTEASFNNAYNGPNGAVTFHYTVKNRGDAPAHHVVLHHTIGSMWLAFGNKQDASDVDLGTIAPGEVKTANVVATASDPLPIGYTPVGTTVRVSGDETDGNVKDNTDTISVMLAYMAGIGYVNTDPVTHGIPANFTITKTNDAAFSLVASSTVGYTIKIKNVGGYANHAVVVDTIKDEAGTTIHTENWDLGDVQSQEEITLTYTALYNASTTPGLYANTAQVLSADGSFPDSEVATSSVFVSTIAPLVKTTGPSVSRILGASIAHASTVAHISENKNLGTTSTTTNAVLTSATVNQNHNRQLASVVTAINMSEIIYWLLVLLIILIGGYAIYRSRSSKWGSV
jgi:hypothetical protein